ncbi:MAG: hypothetical protein ACRETL_04990 [Gammaproteobacteria bacterium]
MNTVAEQNIQYKSWLTIALKWRPSGIELDRPLRIALLKYQANLRHQRPSYHLDQERASLTHVR